ncbi:MAG: hypothetical protein K9K64_13985 [Desulfohalobiaceae bacterium]|nr:hypothetical protein [Desulfohalobiaceae bacterium]MCF8106587.1 hypothetical protein [Desulfohalobiaceae bacterium]
MSRQKKKIAAATTAVFAYIRAQEEVARQEAAQEERAQSWSRPYPAVSPWALSGRQTIMDWRRHLQFRMR